MATIKVSKIDAARRQLDCAIRLWMREGDPVSIHTLAFSAFEIFNDLNKKHGNIDATLLGMTQKIAAAPEHVETIMAYMRGPMTFFKHANRDPTSILEFNTDGNHLTFMFAIKGLDALGEQISDLHIAFLHWMQLHHPRYLLKEAKPFTNSMSTEAVERLRAASKQEFIDTFIETLVNGRRKLGR